MLEQFDDLLVKILLLAAIISFVSIATSSVISLDAYQRRDYYRDFLPARDFHLFLNFHGPPTLH